MGLPLALRFLLYLILADLGAYWVHRLLHTAPLWRTHKWHQAPTELYWLSGVRSSLTQVLLCNMSYIFVGCLLNMSSGPAFYMILIKNNVANTWMHLNVPWGTRWL